MMTKRRTILSAFKQGMDNPRKATPTFTLQQLLLFGLGIALLCGLRWFEVAIFVSLYATIYYAYLGLGWSLTRRRETPMASPFPILELRDNSTIPALVTVISCNLISYVAWHVLIIMFGIDDFFFAPVIGGFSLYMLQQVTLVLLHITLLVSYFGNCWNAPRVDPAECRTTAAFSFFLTISHIAQPWAVYRLLELRFWLWPIAPLDPNS